jgi:hypothetical protein
MHQLIKGKKYKTPRVGSKENTRQVSIGNLSYYHYEPLKARKVGKRFNGACRQVRGSSLGNIVGRWVSRSVNYLSGSQQTEKS